MMMDIEEINVAKAGGFLLSEKQRCTHSRSSLKI